MKKSLIMIIVAALTMMLMSGCNKTTPVAANSTAQASAQGTAQASQETVQETAQETAQEADAGKTELVFGELGELLSGKHHVEIEVKDYGIIKCELDADTAPISVTNFIELASAGYYDGVTFHRIIDGFMAQGGDPTGTGTGGSGRNIKGEFSENGVENNLSHVRGTISMARATNKNSASSQFFIVQEDCPSLDGKYAAFGTVTEGMEIVDELCKAAKSWGADSNGMIPAANQPVIASITVID